MAQIILNNGQRISIEENKQQLFELINDDKQFITVNLEYTIDKYINEYTSDTERKVEQTLINKTHISQAF